VSTVAVPGGLWTALIFGAALALRLLHLRQIANAPFFTLMMGDSRAYDVWAQTIAGGDWIGREVFYQAPLYPYFLGVIYSVAGRDLVVVRIVQSVLGSIACVLIAHAVGRLFGRRAAIVAGIIAALYPASIFFDGLIQKTALDGFLTSLALWIVTGILTRGSKPADWLGLGLVMGALSLTRENALALAAALLVWALVRSWKVEVPLPARAAPAAAFVIGLAILLAPVAIRNALVGGGFYLTTSQFGPNLYLGNNPRTDGTAGSLIAGRGSAEYERQDAIDLAERATGRVLTPGEVSSYWTDQTLQFIRAQPGAWLRLMARKTALLWNSYEAFDTESQESHAEWSLPLRSLAWIGHFGVLVPLAVFGLWATWDDRRRLAILYAIVAVYAASVVMFFIYARYRYPLVPFLIVFAAAGLVRAPSFLRTRSSQQIAAAAAAFVLAAVLTNWPLLAAADTRAVTEHNLGAALQAEGRLDAAIEHYRRAVGIDPSYVPSYSNMGAALLASGDSAGAVAAYERALAIRPDFHDAHYNLGNALIAQGRPAAAIPHFEQALAGMPQGVDAQTNLGIALMLAGRTDQALAALQRAVVLAPKSAPARHALGQLLVEQGRLSEAIEHLSIAAGLAPAAEVHNDLGAALAAGGRLDEAIEQFSEALRLDPASAEARRNLQAATAERRSLDPVKR
jgi:tetratricopeptide (TPR) repeat protein